MSLHISIQVISATPHRVEVGVGLLPEGSSASVQGAAVELRGRQGESLGPQVLLPVSGTLAGALSVKAEVRAEAPIPKDALVVATAWGDHGETETACPAEKPTDLERHLRGLTEVVPPGKNLTPAMLSCLEREQLAKRLPWITAFRCTPKNPGPVVVDEPLSEQVNGVVEALHLANDDAALLRELLAEDNAAALS